MTRVRFLACLLGACYLSVSDPASGDSLEVSKPNILIIVSEDNGPELGCYGDPFARTPHLDQLAAEGVLFSRAYVPQAGCSQSRASLLTGLYPHQHGQIGLATWGFRLSRQETPNLPRSLKAVGYRTGIIGKLHINPASAFPFDFHEIKSANFARENMDNYARHAEAFIAAGEEPFFLSVNYPEAHKPWIRQVAGLPKQPQSGDDVQAMPYMGIDSPALREMVADHYNCMSRLDSLVGELLRTLDRSGKADDTIVIYLGDHGSDFLRGKRTCYEGGLRVPLLIRWPGRIAPQVRDELVSTVDLMPTLLDAVGSEPVDRLAGVSLLPLLRGSSPAWRTHLFAEYHTHAAAPNYFPQRCVRNDRYKLIESLLPDTVHPDYHRTIQKLHEEHAERTAGETLNLHSAITAAASELQAAYQVMQRPPRYQLYDLQQDAYEFHNLADSSRHAEILAELKGRLAQWRQESDDPLLVDGNLRRLTKEVQSVASKSAARKHRWKYPEYFSDTAAQQASIQPPRETSHSGQPNVLMIIVDDMNDWVSCLGGHPDVRTPNIDRLAERGLLFTNAHVAAPVCNPSRVATLTGRRPSTTGIYNNSVVWHRAFPGITTIPHHFKTNGYRVAGGGKVYHHMPGFNRRSDWHEYFDQVFEGHYQDRLSRGLDVSAFQWPAGFPLNRLQAVRTFSRPPRNAKEFDWGPLDKPDDEMGDGQMVEWAVQFLSQPPRGEPFFLAAGIYRPHLPFYSPRSYFEKYPQETITLPAVKNDDLDDLPAAGVRMSEQRRGDYELVMHSGRYREFLQAYLAGISFADALVGRLLGALDASPAAKNTIVVFWSDHGWHLGEKQHLHKFTLWERSTRVPFIIAAPGVTQSGTRCRQAVGLIDLFPTLNRLCSLPPVDNLDGVSLVPLLHDPQAEWERPALTTHSQGNHAIRTRRWRYIRYADGGEELYDHRSDPHEWTNLAEDPSWADVKLNFANRLPKNDAAALKRKRSPPSTAPSILAP